MSARSDGEAALLTLIQYHGLPAPQREWRFGRALSPPREWRFDFAWPQLFVAVEVEGGLWVAGRHNRGSTIEADMVKYSEAAMLGWTVIRVSTAMVDSGAAMPLIQRALKRSVKVGTWPFEQMCKAVLADPPDLAIVNAIATEAVLTAGAFDRGDVILPEQMTLVPHG